MTDVVNGRDIVRPATYIETHNDNPTTQEIIQQNEWDDKHPDKFKSSAHFMKLFKDCRITGIAMSGYEITLFTTKGDLVLKGSLDEFERLPVDFTYADLKG